MTEVLNVMIADDEATARKRMRRLLSAFQDVVVVAECESGDAALRAIEEHEVDLALLDIQMPGLSGIETRALMPEDAPYTVFVTAHPDHAVRAFEVAANDYVLKPVDASRLKAALERARAHLTRPMQQKHERLAFQTSKGVVLVDPSQISHAELDNQLVSVHADQEVYLVDESLSQLEKMAPNLLERVHRRALLNLAHVARLEPVASGGYLAHLRSGAEVEVSRQAARRLRRRLGLR